MKLLFYIITTSIIILNSSCATLIYGTKEKITLRSNQSGTMVKLNNEPAVALKDCVIISKKNKTPILELSKPGFETQTFKFRRVPLPGARGLMATGFGIGGWGTLFGLVFLPIGEELATAGAISMGVGLTFLIPSLVDVSTKAANTFCHKSLEFDMIPIPKKAVTDSMETIACNSVNFKINPGTSIGTSYSPYKRGFKKDKDILWEETSNVLDNELEVQVNNDLNDFGYPVPGLIDKFKSEPKNARFTINSEIKEINLSQYSYVASVRSTPMGGNKVLYETTYTFDHFCKFKTTWSVYDNKKEKVVYQEDIITSAFGNEQSIKLVLFKTLSGSLKKLMMNPAFVKELKKSPQSTFIEPVSTADLIDVTIVKPAAKLSEVIESAITIDNGNNGHGSGFIISADGYALTNNHVIEGTKNITVILSNGLSLDAQVIRTDEKTDVALIKIQGKGFKPAALNLNEVAIGSNIIAIGTPGKKELGQTISKGIISGKRELENGIFLQTDVSISPGSSGGPVLNEQNEVIGIITSKLVGKGIEGIGFAIPLPTALSKLNIRVK